MESTAWRVASSPVGSPSRHGDLLPPSAPRADDTIAAAQSGLEPVGGSSSHSSSHLGSMFHLSPEAQGGLPPAGDSLLSLPWQLAAAADVQHGDGCSDSEAGDDLSSFLADLKSKYGLLDLGAILAEPDAMQPDPPATDIKAPLAVNVSLVVSSRGPAVSSSPPPRPSLPLPQAPPESWSLNPLWNSSPEAAAASGLQHPQTSEALQRSGSAPDDSLVSILPPPWWQEPSAADQPPNGSTDPDVAAQQPDQELHGTAAPAAQRDPHSPQQQVLREARQDPEHDALDEIDEELQILEELQRQAAHQPPPAIQAESYTAQQQPLAVQATGQEAHRQTFAVQDAGQAAHQQTFVVQEAGQAAAQQPVSAKRAADRRAYQQEPAMQAAGQAAHQQTPAMQAAGQAAHQQPPAVQPACHAAHQQPPATASQAAGHAAPAVEKDINSAVESIAPAETNSGSNRNRPKKASAQCLQWQALHTALVQRGFPGLLHADEDADLSTQQPDPAALFEAVQSLLQEHVRCSTHQQCLAEAAQAAARREGALVSSFGAASKKKDAEIAKWKRLALENQVAARDAQRSSHQCRGASDELAAEARQLQALASRHQHGLSMRDAEVERLKQALAGHQERQERRQRADKEAYERLKRAYAASKAADTPGGASTALKAVSRELKPLDLMRIFEAERANLQEVAAVAAAEARAAEAQLARAQEALHSAGLPCDHFDEIEGQARAAARQAALAEERAAQLEEEAAALRQELKERPTQAQLESLQRQADIMERRLAKAEADKLAAQAKEAKEAKSRPKPKQLSTREMIHRDRNMQRLGLQSVEELPKPVLVEVVQDACALLECRQPLELCAAIRPVQDLAALVPRMERFIGDVCGAVFQRGMAHVPQSLRQDNPADVPAVLAAWIAELSELVEMRGVLRALLRQLASRVSVRPTDPPPTASEVVPLVASLVELERKVYHSREVIEAAETALAAQPDILINRICLQFQRLFGCRSLEGCLPAMNKLYLAHTEAQTFLASLRAALGLEPSATLEACANRLEQLQADRRGALATMLPAQELHAAAPVLPASAHAVVVEVAPRRRDLQQAAQVAVERMAAKRKWPKVQIFVPASSPGEQEVAVC